MKIVFSYRPAHIEPEIFYEELRFWKINERLMETFIEEDMVNSFYLSQSFIQKTSETFR